MRAMLLATYSFMRSAHSAGIIIIISACEHYSCTPSFSVLGWFQFLFLGKLASGKGLPVKGTVTVCIITS